MRIAKIKGGERERERERENIGWERRETG